jgi:hypothetical protein
MCRTSPYEAVIADLWKRYADACLEHRPTEARHAKEALDALRLVQSPATG